MKSYLPLLGFILLTVVVFGLTNYVIANSSPVILTSKEVSGNSEESRNLTENQKIDWQNQANDRGFGVTETLSFKEKEPVNPLSLKYNQSNTLEISLVDMEDEAGNVNEDDVFKGHPGSTIKLSSGDTLQGGSPRPTGLYNSGNQEPFWNENSGSSSSRNAVLFTFSQPVGAFGAWFGDLETRTDGKGKPAEIRLFNEAGDLLKKEELSTSTLDQSACGSSSFKGCGNKTTRWLGFISSQSLVKEMLVIVGDDDSPESGVDSQGFTEHFSFIGPTVGIKEDGFEENQSGYSVEGVIWYDKNWNRVFDDTESGIEGAIVFIDENDNLIRDQGEEFVTTTNQGKFVFSGLLEGHYYSFFTELDSISPEADFTSDGRMGVYIDGMNYKGLNSGVHVHGKSVTLSTIEWQTEIVNQAETISFSLPRIDDHTGLSLRYEFDYLPDFCNYSEYLITCTPTIETELRKHLFSVYPIDSNNIYGNEAVFEIIVVPAENHSEKSYSEQYLSDSAVSEVEVREVTSLVRTGLAE
jgi:hypothetical protein